MNGRILVTGGSGGIGAGVVARHRDRCVVWSRRANGVDVTDPDGVRAAAGAFLRQHGAPFAIVHGVGDFEERSLLSTDDAAWRRLLDSNLTSAFLVATTLVPAMCEARRGRVIFFSAAGAEDRTAKPRAPAYFAAKAALTSLARSLAKEVAPYGVTVNVIAPGVVVHPDSHAASQERMTPKVPLGRAGTVDDLLGAIDLLLGDAGAYVTGDVWTIDGGLSL
ncbi:MAG: SDR family oxidoreductase [Planctomycetes bacterium]|nr:SDR family oxidoreductase [Planctomycetota bacterium]